MRVEEHELTAKETKLLKSDQKAKKRALRLATDSRGQYERGLYSES